MSLSRGSRVYEVERDACVDSGGYRVLLSI